MDRLTEVLASIASIGVVVRVGIVLVGLTAMLVTRQRAGTVRWDLSMKVAFPEPFLLGTAVWWTRPGTAPSWPGDALALVTAAVGAAIVVSAIALMIWAWRSYRDVGTGHYIDAEHRLVTSGAYAIVRHPFYTAAVLCWIGLAITSRSVVVAAALGLYVVPVYVWYSRSEERLLGNEFGEVYEHYVSSIPMLWPRLRLVRSKRSQPSSKPG